MLMTVSGTQSPPRPPTLEPPSSFLFDTNIFFPMEDNRIVGEALAELSRLCSKHSVKLFGHASSKDDIERDPQPIRKEISLSKLSKYNLFGKVTLSDTERERLYGTIKNENDVVDTDLLHALTIGAAQYLISEDAGLHKRVKEGPLADRVLYVTGALNLIIQNYETSHVSFPRVEALTCQNANLAPENPFFNELKVDYEEQTFINWLNKCIAENRECFAIRNGTSLLGLIILNPESKSVSKHAQEHDDLGIPGKKVLKLCLFRLTAEIRREKYGEQLLKTAMYYGFQNKYDTLYLTVFPKHDALIKLIKKFGFIEGKMTKLGELTFYKHMNPSSKAVLSGFNFHRSYWPIIDLRHQHHFIIPIRPEYHSRLFPEATTQAELPFGITEPVISAIPGNAIRKVYICHSPTSILPEGSILWFYCSVEQKHHICRSS